jgi:hypothetical protein
MRYIRVIKPFTDFYSHHLVMDLPPRQLNASWDLVRSTHPTEMNRQPEQLIHNLTEVDPLLTAMRQETLRIQQLIDMIYELFVEVSPSTLANRKRRYWCIFYCSDVATQTDMDLVKKYNEDAGNVTARNFAKIQHVVDAMASYTKLSDQKFEALRYIIERQQYNAQMGSASVRKTQAFVGAIVNLFIPNALHLMNLHSALVLLKHNILTFDVLPLAQARSIIKQIRQHIKQWPMRYLVDADELSLYREADISYFRTASTLHISLKVKVSSFQHPLHLFKIEKFDLGIPGQDHTTVLEDLPEYIAINDYDPEYLIFYRRPELQKDKYYFMETQEHEILSKQFPTCVTALFHDKLSMIKRLCETYLQPYSDKPVMRYVGANLILFRNIPTYQVITGFNKSLTVMTNCTACLKTAPCGSKIQAQKYVAIIPTCSIDQQGRQPELPAHIVNMHLLLPFLDEQFLKDFSTEFTFNNPIQMTLPNITVYKPQGDQKLSDAFRTLGMQTIHLTTALNQTLEKGLIFQSASDHIVYKLSEEGFGHQIAVKWKAVQNFFSNPFQIFTKIDMMLQWIAIAYLFYRSRILSAALAARQISAQRIANSSQVRKLEEFMQQLNAVTPTSPMFVYKPQLSEQYHVVDILIFITLITIGIYLASKLTVNRLKRNTTQLFAHIIGPHDDVLIKLMTLPHRSYLYHFKADTFVQSISISGILLPEVHIVWPSLKIQHQVLARIAHIPMRCNINYYQATKLRRILLSNFEFLLFTKDSDSPNFRLIPLEGSLWKKVETKTRPTRGSERQLWHSNSALQTDISEFV